MTNPRKKLLAAVIVPIQIASAVLAWRELSRLSDDQVRGNKRLWRMAVLINPGNSLAFWIFGRR